MAWQPRSWGEPGLGAAVVNVQRLELFPLLLLQFPSVSSPAGVGPNPGGLPHRSVEAASTTSFLLYQRVYCGTRAVRGVRR